MNIPNQHPADVLLALKAQIADLETLAKVQHARLVEMGPGAHEGEIARASVSIADRETIAWKAVAQALLEKYKNDNANGWQTKLVASNATVTRDIATVRVAARKG